MAIATCSSALNDRALCTSIALTKLDLLVKHLARQPVLQFEILLLRRLQMRRDRVQRRALGEVEPTDCPPDQCLHSAEADVRPPRRKSGFDPKGDIGGAA